MEIKDTEGSGESQKREELLAKNREAVLSAFQDLVADSESEEFQERVDKMAELITKKDEAALIDELTGIYNRRGFDLRLDEEMARGKRTGTKTTLVIADLNELKTINDKEGHFIGDEQIQSSANLLKNLGRESDVIARIGGDEFAILLTNTDIQGAFHWGHRLTQTFHVSGVNISMGAAEINHDSTDADKELADKRMYHAKEIAHQTGENTYFDGTAKHAA